MRASLHGETVELSAGLDLQKIFHLANQHHVLPMVVDVAWRSGVQEVLLRPVQSMAVSLVMLQTRRTAAFLTLYRSLAEEGLYPLILKGLVCRLLYPEPDQRPSVDEDLLIEPEMLPVVHEALLRYGMHCDCDEPSAKLHEITYSGTDLSIELHMSPFPADSSAYGDLNALFSDAPARAVTIEAEGVAIKTFGYADHLLYLICHACKHFLHSGVGIRQVCDIAVFSKRFRKEIDWQEVRVRCEQVHIERFSAAVFAIASRHLGFDMPEVFADLRIDERAMLQDMLSGGVYGAADENRQHSATITLDAVAAHKKGRKRTGFMTSVFLPYDSMKAKYTYLQKHAWLLPAAWMQRVGHYLLHRGKNANPVQSLRIGNERVELLREYGIIEK